MKNYDDYIVFVLGTDNFNFSQKLRNMYDLGMDELYGVCVYIAQKFEEYDNYTIDMGHNISQYENLCRFLHDYEKQIDDYLIDYTEFEIVKE